MGDEIIHLTRIAKPLTKIWLCATLIKQLCNSCSAQVVKTLTSRDLRDLRRQLSRDQKTEKNRRVNSQWGPILASQINATTWIMRQSRKAKL